MASSSYISEDVPAGAFETKTISTAALGVTSSLVSINQAGGFVKRAQKAFVTVETNSIRVRYDGTDPDASTGHLFTAGSSFTVTGETNISRLRMIRASADAAVMITIYYNR